MKKILLCFILMLSCLTITACKGEEEALNDEIDTSSSEYILYSNAKSNGYSDSFELWESELESNIILLRMVDTNIEWMFNTSTSWNKLYDDDGTSPSWYRQFVAGNVYEYYQYYTVTFNTNCSSKIESQIVEK